MSNFREVKDGVQVQGVGEEIPYTVDVSNWPNPPTSPEVSAVDEDGADATDTIFPSGSPSVASNVITLPLCKSGVAGVVYKVTVSYTYNSTTKLACYFFVRFE
jgi:hypothetical protein